MTAQSEQTPTSGEIAAQPPWIAGVLERIEAAPIRRAPFPYIAVPDLLPQDVYREALHRWPGADLFKVANFQLRKQLRLHKVIAEGALQDRVWHEILQAGAHVSRALLQKFRPLLATKFEPLLGAEWRRKMAGSGWAPTLFLAQYTGKIGLHPHVDAPEVIANSFLYVSEREDIEPDLGTMLYRTFGLSFPENDLTFPKEWASFLAPHALVPYRPNTLLAFVNTPISFHGVEYQDIGERVRRIMLFTAVHEGGRADLMRRFKADPVTIDAG